MSTRPAPAKSVATSATKRAAEERRDEERTPLCFVADVDGSIRHFLSLVLHGSGIDRRGRYGHRRLRGTRRVYRRIHRPADERHDQHRAKQTPGREIPSDGGHVASSEIARAIRRGSELHNSYGMAATPR